MEQKQYIIFDKDDPDGYTLRLTSNKNIKNVCEVLTGYKNLSFQERMYYAKKLDVIPVAKNEKGEIDKDEDGNAIVEFFNRYETPIEYYAALAEALFVGCPKLGDLDGEGNYILRDEQQQLIDTLIRENVHRAKVDFLGKFGLKPYSQNDLLDLFQIDPTKPNSLINQAADILAENSTMIGNEDAPMKTPSGIGEIES